MLFCAPSMKKLFSPPRFLHLTPIPSLPIMTLSHHEHFLSGCLDATAREAAFFVKRGHGDGPRGRGRTTREHACIIKSGQRGESKAWNLLSKSGLRRYGWSKIRKTTPVHLFVYCSSNLWRLCQKRGSIPSCWLKHHDGTVMSVQTHFPPQEQNREPLEKYC